MLGSSHVMLEDSPKQSETGRISYAERPGLIPEKRTSKKKTLRIQSDRVLWSITDL